MGEVPLKTLTLERLPWLRRARSALPTWRRVSRIRVSGFEFVRDESFGVLEIRVSGFEFRV